MVILMFVALQWDIQKSLFSITTHLSTTPGSPLIKNLTIAILQLSESGELTHLREKWWASSCIGTDRAHRSEALQPHDLRGLFLLLGLGVGIGLLLALLELLSRARNQAKDGKVKEEFHVVWSCYVWFLFTFYALLSQKSCCSVLTSELNRRFGSGGEDAEQESSDKNKAWKRGSHASMRWVSAMRARREPLSCSPNTLVFCYFVLTSVYFVVLYSYRKACRSLGATSSNRTKSNKPRNIDLQTLNPNHSVLFAGYHSFTSTLD